MAVHNVKNKTSGKKFAADKRRKGFSATLAKTKEKGTVVYVNRK